METFHKMGDNEPRDVFDPSRHHLVAVDKVTKLHFHVTLEEIARDAQASLAAPLAAVQPVVPADASGEIAALQQELSRLGRLLLGQERSMQAIVQALADASVLQIEENGEIIQFEVKRALETVLRHGRFMRDAEANG